MLNIKTMKQYINVTLALNVETSQEMSAPAILNHLSINVEGDDVVEVFKQDVVDLYEQC